MPLEQILRRLVAMSGPDRQWRHRSYILDDPPLADGGPARAIAAGLVVLQRHGLAETLEGTSCWRPTLAGMEAAA